MEHDNRTLIELEKTYLSGKSVAEFDRIVRKSESRRRIQIAWGAMLVTAASLALIVFLWPTQVEPSFNGMEIAEGIQQIMNLDMDKVKSVTATPDGHRIILIAEMDDGRQYSYVMSRDGETEAVSITAME